MLGGVTKALLASFLEHFISSSRVVASSTCVGEQLRVVHQIVLNKIVCIFRGHLIITRLDSTSDLFVILRTETTIVGKAVTTVCFL